MSRFAQKKVRWVFFSLACLFMVPLLLASWLALKEKPSFSHTTNHGQLLQPPLDIAPLNLNPPKNWLLLYNHSKMCDEACAKVLYNIRQIRTATGKDMDRVRGAILTLQTQDAQLQQLLEHDFKGILHFVTSQEMLQQFKQKQSFEEGIYIVDPLGNMMMYYPQNADPMGIFKDLTRLLKLSHIG